jgi:hypothetical protein
VGARRKYLAGHTPKGKRFIATTAMQTRKSRAAEKAHLEQENVKAPKNNKQTGPTASSPQEKPPSSPVDPKPAMEEKENTTGKSSQNEPPMPPREAGTPRKTRILPERQQIESSLPAAVPPEPAPPAPGGAETPESTGTLADIGWMPPAEDQVARFLSDVAEIAPPPAREREGARAAGFILPSAISAEEAERKKAKAQPFWSQVVATPMERLEKTAAPVHPRRAAARRRARRRLLWISMVICILILVLLSLAFVLYKDPSMLPHL